MNDGELFFDRVRLYFYRLREQYFKRPPKKKVYPKTCQNDYCTIPLNTLSFYCKYCHKYFCEVHRLPEDHKCYNPKLPKEYQRIAKGHIIKL